MSISMSAGQAGRQVGVDPGAGVSLVSLLITLTTEHPDLDQHAIAQIVEHAAATAERLSPGLGYSHRQVELLARDRLEVATWRTACSVRRDAEVLDHTRSRNSSLS